MNAVVIFTDQMHKYALGCVDPLYQTPNLDDLARDGVLFTNAYSNNPLCGPYRGCLMTGLYTSKNGLIKNNMPLPAQIPPLARLLRDHGWQTGFTGKWHLGGRGAEPIPEFLRGGFEHFRAYQMYNGFDPDAPYENRVAFYDEENTEHIYKEHRTRVTTRLAKEMLSEMAQKNSPFLLVVGYQAPHYPEQPEAAFEKLYENTVFPVTGEEACTEPYTPTFNPRSPEDRTLSPDYRRYGGNMQEYKRLYAAMVSGADAGVGEIIALLKEKNLYEDTLIIFTSDHGDMQGSHGLTNKGVPYEMSAGVPMIARVPGGRKNTVCEHPVSGVDIFETLMELSGIPERRDGNSLLSYIKGDTDEAPNAFIVSENTAGDNLWRMIRLGKYKLVLSQVDQKPVMLFDLEADRDERDNLLEGMRADKCLVSHMAALLEAELSGNTKKYAGS